MYKFTFAVADKTIDITTSDDDDDDDEDDDPSVTIDDSDESNSTVSSYEQELTAVAAAAPNQNKKQRQLPVSPKLIPIPMELTSSVEESRGSVVVSSTRPAAPVRGRGGRIVLCSKCNLEFDSSSLARHMSYHEKRADRPYTCVPCDLHYSTKSGLKTHQRYNRAHVMPEEGE
jgi:hypothetical protein